MQVLIELAVDRSLMPELAAGSATLGNRLFGGLVNEVKMV